MNNLKTYEEMNERDGGNAPSPFIKNFGEEYPLSQLQKGDKISYQGKTLFVVEPGEHIIIAHTDSNGDSTGGQKINQRMFDSDGAIFKKTE